MGLSLDIVASIDMSVYSGDLFVSRVASRVCMTILFAMILVGWLECVIVVRLGFSGVFRGCCS